MTAADPLAGLSVFQRGWLSSNNVLIHAASGEAGAVLVDTGHLNHAAQTLALVQQALGFEPLARIVNTHLHSDHCGGNALLQRHFGAPVAVPPGQAQAARDWDQGALSYVATGQRIERYTVDEVYAPGQPLHAGGRDWQVLAAPGHDPHSVMLFDRASGLLISADALWENGFGVVFPEIAGEPGFDDVAAVLDLIDTLPVRCVIPGHGAPFGDVRAALARARSRLAGFRTDPARHARHALKVLLKYHLMEERSQPLPELLDWAVAAPLVGGMWERFVPVGVGSAAAWVQLTVDELVGAQVLARQGDLVSDV
jgi:glyoxylase-like metal-dependent hydrolase (beta-lactamase superfamily II)